MDKKGQNEQNRKIWTNLDRWTVKDKMKNKDNFTKMRQNWQNWQNEQNFDKIIMKMLDKFKMD